MKNGKREVQDIANEIKSFAKTYKPNVTDCWIQLSDVIDPYACIVTNLINKSFTENLNKLCSSDFIYHVNTREDDMIITIKPNSQSF